MEDMVYVALLRAVNVAATWIAMADLRALAERLGLKNARTVLQSGNLIFESPDRAAIELERRLESALLRRFDIATPVIVRSATELGRVVSNNPFPDEARRDPAHLAAVFLKDAPTPASVRVLAEAIVGRERIVARGKTLYAVYPDGMGRSKLTAALIDRKLETHGTARNWNTVLKLTGAA
jgi:uncharacterized protein (DUF1697 family)